jgi:hypothetical protein
MELALPFVPVGRDVRCSQQGDVSCVLCRSERREKLHLIWFLSDTNWVIFLIAHHVHVKYDTSRLLQVCRYGITALYSFGIMKVVNNLG